jgi:hypothetical protein
MDNPGIFDHLITNLRAREAHIMQSAAEMVGITVIEGEALQRENLLLAVTRTGQARVDSGRGLHAGRYESGHMYDEIDSDELIADNVFMGSWGWPKYEEYFEDQDKGTGAIEAANSLMNSFEIIRLVFRARVAELAAGTSEFL